MSPIMRSIVLTQVVAALVVAVISGALAGVGAMWSALFGGLCIAVPNGMFAAYVWLNTFRPANPNSMRFFIAEFIKLIFTISLMGLTIWLYRDIRPLAFMCGVILVLKSYFIYLYRQRHGRS